MRHVKKIWFDINCYPYILNIENNKLIVLGYLDFYFFKLFRILRFFINKQKFSILFLYTGII